jgi:hypothetical protein
VIIVVGRPGLNEEGELAGTVAGVALAAVGAGAQVELVGSVGDDPDGDAAVVELGRRGIGHAALLRDPAGVTPRAGGTQLPGATTGPLPRLDAGDIDLGLHYHADCRVIVLAEPVDAEAAAIAADGAEYHRATLVLLMPAGASGPENVPAGTTVLEMPAEDEGAFAALVGRYAALLDAGRPQEDAWQEALAGSGWESASE